MLIACDRPTNALPTGDMAYDLSKTYQSLQGYDFMLLDWPIDEHVGKVLVGQWISGLVTTFCAFYCNTVTQPLSGKYHIIAI
jgi:hypothetical protein